MKGSVFGSRLEIQRFSQAEKATDAKPAAQPGKINRDSVSNYPGITHINDGIAYPKFDRKSLNEYQLSALSDKAVDKKLSQLGAEVKTLTKEIRQAKRAAKRSSEALGDLKKRSSNLEKHGRKIRSGVKRAMRDSPRENYREFKSLDRALKKAKSTVSEGKQLLKRCDSKSKTHNINMEDMKQEVGDQISKAKQEVKILKEEIKEVNKKYKAACKREKFSKIQQEQNAQAYRVYGKKTSGNEGVDIRVKSSQSTPPQKAGQRKAVDKNEVPVNNLHTKKSTTRATTRALSQKNNNMKRYLSEVEPGKNLSYEAIKNRLDGNMGTPKEFKRELASILTSNHLNSLEKMNLRKKMNIVLLKAMKNKNVFSKFSRTDIEHIMYNNKDDTVKRIIEQFPKSVKIQEDLLNQRARR